MSTGQRADERVIANHLLRQGSLVDRSGMIGTGGSAQQAIGANDARRYLLVQNPSVNEDALWVAFGQVAAQGSPSIELLPGTVLVFESAFVPVGSVSVTAATTSQVYTMWEG